MNIVLIIPTGIGAKIGGHAGDANPVCKLLASLSDTLITHPNVVNASDINEMPENVFYVEGSMLDRFLVGEFCLKQPLQNRILVVVNDPVRNDTYNAVQAAEVTIGIDVGILELKTPLRMVANFEGGIATGDITGWQELVEQVENMDFDALAIHTPIEVPREVALSYYRTGGVNPWGGVEAKASKLIASALNKPVAHAPLENTDPEDTELYRIMDEVVDPRIAPEAISSCYLHCVLKGLNKAPRISSSGLSCNDIDVLVSPYGCFGNPHKACLEQGIPVIVVRENNTILSFIPPQQCIVVENYWEAAGVIACMKAGVSRVSVRAMK
uniref:DUF3326 domain-containing protein n=1 Tax=viral metagenome TaxID=1070528 RepID=A0A6M3INV4_9ZZZZ